MTPLLWAFEYVGLIEKEKLELTTYTRITKALAVNLLGLNTLRPTDANGMPKKIEDMTEKELETFIPLTYWIGREDMMKHLQEQEQTLRAADAAMDNKDYEKLVDDIDKSDGDIDFVMGPIELPKDIANHNHSVAGVNMVDHLPKVDEK